MAISLFINKLEVNEKDEIPFSTHSFFKEYIDPIVQNASYYKLIPLLETGFPVNRRELDILVEEFNRLELDVQKKYQNRNDLVSFITGRIKTITDKLRALKTQDFDAFF